MQLADDMAAAAADSWGFHFCALVDFPIDLPCAEKYPSTCSMFKELRPIFFYFHANSMYQELATA
jgi:hypothetical protein